MDGSMIRSGPMEMLDANIRNEIQKILLNEEKLTS